MFFPTSSQLVVSTYSILSVFHVQKYILKVDSENMDLIHPESVRNQLDKLEAAKAAYLWLPLIAFGYLTISDFSLPFIFFPFLSFP